MFWFTLASLTPALLLGLACLFGSIWPGLAVFSITVWVFFMDRLVARMMPDISDAPGLPLSYALGAAHFALWGLGIWAIGSGGHLSTVDKVLIIIGLGLFFGQISNSNAHELIHNAQRIPRRFGIAIYGSLLFAHHASAHMRVHHVCAATPDDPNTARLGEGFWRYLVRAWTQGFIAGKRAEDRLRGGNAATQSRGLHPYVGYIALTLCAVIVAAVLAGAGGVFALFVIAFYAQVQLYLSDYV